MSSGYEMKLSVLKCIDIHMYISICVYIHAYYMYLYTCIHIYELIKNCRLDLFTHKSKQCNFKGKI